MPRLLLGVPIPEWDNGYQSAVKAPTVRECEPNYTPTLIEIAEACQRIRATWDDAERRRRMAVNLLPVPCELLLIPDSTFEFSSHGSDE